MFARRTAWFLTMAALWFGANGASAADQKPNVLFPLEWTNLAKDAQFDQVKSDLAKWLPKVNVSPGGK